jgi:hypothetical protein
MAVVSLKYKSKQGTLTAPGDVDPGAMIPIATATPSGTGTTTFSNIPQNYEHLQIRLIAATSTSAALLVRFNADDTNSYYNHELSGDGSNAAATSRTPRTGLVIQSGGMPSATSYFGATIIDILDYANTNKYKTVRALSGQDQNGSGVIYLHSGAYPSTTAVSSITVVVNSGYNFNTNTHIALYGIKTAGA